jgi:hypothetical protein
MHKRSFHQLHCYPDTQVIRQPGYVANAGFGTSYDIMAYSCVGVSIMIANDL